MLLAYVQIDWHMLLFFISPPSCHRAVLFSSPFRLVLVPLPVRPTFATASASSSALRPSAVFDFYRVFACLSVSLGLPFSIFSFLSSFRLSLSLSRASRVHASVRVSVRVLVFISAVCRFRF